MSDYLLLSFQKNLSRLNLLEFLMHRLSFLFLIFAYAYFALIYSLPSEVYPFQEPQNGPIDGWNVTSK